ncbi:hypothetical protein PVK06_004955 [Gossypium arboreum]|uniref:Uncharacterized protein n=1 Tax=Gossypium arboreum TaxID=29729 RepID=A0ABR0QTF5_GOSAR|nr:hypothetical protein PVK06_004955 [Gossypium arboreum]
MDSTEHECSDGGEVANRFTKKVRLRETEEESNVVMESTLTTEKPLSWKDRFVGTGIRANRQTATLDDLHEGGDFELSEDDVVRSMIDGNPSINFSKRVIQILIKGMAHTVVIKLLGRNIEYSALQNEVYSLWKPSQSFRLMDVENGEERNTPEQRVDFKADVGQRRPGPSLLGADLAWDHCSKADNKRIRPSQPIEGNGPNKEKTEGCGGSRVERASWALKGPNKTTPRVYEEEDLNLADDSGNLRGPQCSPGPMELGIDEQRGWNIEDRAMSMDFVGEQ